MPVKTLLVNNIPETKREDESGMYVGISKELQGVCFDILNLVPGYMTPDCTNINKKNERLVKRIQEYSRDHNVYLVYIAGKEEYAKSVAEFLNWLYGGLKA